MQSSSCRPRPALSSLATLALLAMGTAACGDDDVQPVTADAAVADAPLAADAPVPADARPPDAPLPDARPPDAPLPDARPPDAGFPDAGVNAVKLWIAGINGSESNLRLQPTEPPFF